MAPEMNGSRVYVPKKSWGELQYVSEQIHLPYPRLGILGGMGPDATGDLFNNINRITRELTTVAKDQDYLSIRVASNPQTPDRTKFINGESNEDPMPHLMMGIDELAQGDRPARIVGIPCNTAHYFVPALEQYIKHEGYDMRIVHMIRETANRIKSLHPDTETVGLLATSGTLRTKLYHGILEENGFRVLEPSEEDQNRLVMEGIYGTEFGEGVKAGFIEKPRQRFLEAASRLAAQGAQVVIEGCTEIPLALKQEDTDIPLVNPTEVLARRMVELALAQKKA